MLQFIDDGSLSHLIEVYGCVSTSLTEMHATILMTSSSFLLHLICVICVCCRRCLHWIQDGGALVAQTRRHLWSASKCFFAWIFQELPSWILCLNFLFFFSRRKHWKLAGDSKHNHPQWICTAVILTTNGLRLRHVLYSSI